MRGCGVRLVVLLLLFLGLFDKEGAVAMNKYSIDLEKLNLKRGYGFNKESENLTFGGLGGNYTVEDEVNDPYPQYNDSLKMALQRARDISFTSVEDGQKSDEQKKFDKTKFLQGIVDASANPFSYTQALKRSLEPNQPITLETDTQSKAEAQSRADTLYPDDSQSRFAQKYLGITVDGDWGRGSTRTLASWQYKNGFSVSGKLDEETLSAMKNPDELDSRKASKVQKSVLNEAGTAPNSTKIKAWAKENISDPIRAAAFVATVEAETGNRNLVEMGYLYSSVKKGDRTPAELAIHPKLVQGTFRGARAAAFNALASDPDWTAADSATKNDMIFDIYYDDQYRDTDYKLGNTQAGDGSRFKGRGLIQLTGRTNYEAVGKLLGIDLISNPELVNDPKYAAPVAMTYLSLPGKDFFSGTLTRDKLKNTVGHDNKRKDGVLPAQTRWNRAQVLKDEMYPGQNN